MSSKKRSGQKKTGLKTRSFNRNFPTFDEESIKTGLNQATSAMNAGDTRQATRIVDEVLQTAASHPDALNLKAVLLLDAGDSLAAVRIFTRITGLIPDFAQAHFNLGTALNALGKPKRAIKSFRRALEINPQYTDALYNLANALRQTDQLKYAVVHYQKALKFEPGHAGALTNLASAQLQLGNPREALIASELALQSDPGNRDAFSFAAIAATEVGDHDKAASLLNPGLLIHTMQFDSRPGFDSLTSFNLALTEHVLKHPTLSAEVHNKATRNGQQTESLALGERGPVNELQNMIGEALDKYLEALGQGNSHPYPPLIPSLSKIDIWGTVLHAQGHQASHMHRAAWISGVYYVKLPDVMFTDDGGNAGWIEFCRPPDEFNCKAEHDIRLIEPKEGLLVLFPSYLYHRTIPFISDDLRISIAFDLLA